MFLLTLGRAWMLPILFLLPCIVLNTALGKTTQIELGKQHPVLTSWSIQGDQVISLDAYRNTKVLVIYFSTWTRDCRKAIDLWLETTKEHVENQKLVVLGAMLEHHRDRCRLFAQWKGIEIPVLHDPLNQAGVEKLPLLVGVDEHGVVQVIDPDPGRFTQDFISKKFKPSPLAIRAPVVNLPNPKYTARMAEEARNAKGWREHGDALVLAGLSPQINEAILTYPQALKVDPQDSLSYFRLGAAYRLRYDSSERQPGDFQAAIDAWQEAVRVAPRNKVFHSNIQRYGVRHEKPASMYRWIKTARRELLARGETPVQLNVEPSPIEFAKRTKKFTSSHNTGPANDVSKQETQDGQRAVDFESVVVRSTRSKSKRRHAQVLLIFRPIGGRSWYKQGEPMRVWIEPPKYLKVNRRFIEFANSESATSGKERTLNFEVSVAKKMRKKPISIKGHAVFQMMDGEEPKQLRRDFEVKFTLIKD